MKEIEKTVYPILSVAVKYEQDIALVRQRAQAIAALVGLSTQDQTRLTTAISEVVRNVFQHMGGSQVKFDLCEQDGQQLLLVTVCNQGGATPDWQAILNESQQSIGQRRIDLFGAQRLVDYFYVKTEAEVENLKDFPWPNEVWHTGPSVVLGKILPLDADFRPGHSEKLSEWADSLINEAPRTPLQEIQQQNQELIQVLEELQHKEQALEQQLQEIKRLEKTRDDLTRTMVHDLRNPLSIIHASLASLMAGNRDAFSDDQREMLEIASLGTQRMVKLVNNILDVSRLESGQMPLDYQPISLPKLIAETLHAQSLLADFKNITLDQTIPADLPPVEADIDLIGRVLQNLVDNALKFTPEGGRVAVSVAVDEPLSIDRQRAKRRLARENLKDFPPGEPPFVSISVTDNGPGISPELQERLFQKFVAGSHKEKGSGLGLTFCKLVVEAHGGRIRFSSLPDQETTFTFTLPGKSSNDPE